MVHATEKLKKPIIQYLTEVKNVCNSVNQLLQPMIILLSWTTWETFSNTALKGFHFSQALWRKVVNFYIYYWWKHCWYQERCPEYY